MAKLRPASRAALSLSGVMRETRATVVHNNATFCRACSALAVICMLVMFSSKDVWFEAESEAAPSKSLLRSAVIAPNDVGSASVSVGSANVSHAIIDQAALPDSPTAQPKRPPLEPRTEQRTLTEAFVTVDPSSIAYLVITGETYHNSRLKSAGVALV